MIPNHKRTELIRDIACAINKNSVEHIGGDTPDFILAEYLVSCLEQFGETVKQRSDWYGPPAIALPPNMPSLPPSGGASA